MAYVPTADQVDLQDGIRRLCRGRFPIDRVRTAEGDPGAVGEMWHELAEAGVFSLRVAEVDGGAGLSIVDAVLIYEELGRALLPGPLVGAQLAAPMSASVADGTRIVGTVEFGGGPLFVEHFAVTDAVLVFGSDSVELVELVGLDGTPVSSPLDPLTPFHLVGALPTGVVLGGTDLCTRLQVEGALLTAALMIGIARATCDMAVSYANERRQFGRVIGSFQAVKHLIADMYVRAELAAAATYGAATAIDGEVPSAARLLSSAKISAGRAAVRNAQDCIHVHGGVGFTWEHPAHLYLKRAWVLSSGFGSVEHHADLVAAAL